MNCCQCNVCVSGRPSTSDEGEDVYTIFPLEETGQLSQLAVRGYHAYKDAWTPEEGEILDLVMEPYNDHDPYSVKVRHLLDVLKQDRAKRPSGQRVPQRNSKTGNHKNCKLMKMLA